MNKETQLIITLWCVKAFDKIREDLDRETFTRISILPKHKFDIYIHSLLLFTQIIYVTIDINYLCKESQEEMESFCMYGSTVICSGKFCLHGRVATRNALLTLQFLKGFLLKVCSHLKILFLNLITISCIKKKKKLHLYKFNFLLRERTKLNKNKFKMFLGTHSASLVTASPAYVT